MATWTTCWLVSCNDLSSVLLICFLLTFFCSFLTGGHLFLCPSNPSNGCLVAGLQWSSLLDTSNNPFTTNIFSERACHFTGLAASRLFPLSWTQFNPHQLLCCNFLCFYVGPMLSWHPKLCIGDFCLLVYNGWLLFWTNLVDGMSVNEIPVRYNWFYNFSELLFLHHKLNAKFFGLRFWFMKSLLFGLPFFVVCLVSVIFNLSFAGNVQSRFSKTLKVYEIVVCRLSRIVLNIGKYCLQH